MHSVGRRDSNGILGTWTIGVWPWTSGSWYVPCGKCSIGMEFHGRGLQLCPNLQDRYRVMQRRERPETKKKHCDRRRRWVCPRSCMVDSRHQQGQGIL